MRKKSVSSLKKKADLLWSKATRLRWAEKKGTEWYCKCCTCGKELPLKQIHCGHFMSRRHSATRYSEINTAPQCAACNTFNQGEQYKFSQFIDLTYGDGTAKKLQREAHKTHKLTTQELEDIIHDCNEEIKFYEGVDNSPK